MRTNIELDDDLVEQALKISKLKTKKDVVNEALKQYVASLKKNNFCRSVKRIHGTVIYDKCGKYERSHTF